MNDLDKKIESDEYFLNLVSKSDTFERDDLKWRNQVNHWLDVSFILRHLKNRDAIDQ
jgi:hypothetical protein